MLGAFNLKKMEKLVVNSSLELDNSKVDYIVEILKNQQIIGVVTVYLLVTLLMMFIAKFVLSETMEFSIIKKIPFNIGNLLTRFIKFYIRI